MTAYLARRQSSRNNYRDPPTFLLRALNLLCNHFRLQTNRLETFVSVKAGRRVRLPRNWRVFTFANLVTLLWFVTLYRGERLAVRNAVDSCDWSFWERWGGHADPHHLIFVADPQLVDPHSYPGRPWPLSSLTVFLTDLYMKRAYSRLQRVLQPDTVIFLGDLFDGGREWSTENSQNPDPRWSKWGQKQWLKEYERFGKVFMQHHNDGAKDGRPGHRGRKLLTGLPGNHDLGFAGGVHVPVRERFSAYFGEGNRVDVIGNHTFVSLDTVSLSSIVEEDAENKTALWKPTADFLSNYQPYKNRIVHHELRSIFGRQGQKPYDHKVEDTKEFLKHQESPIVKTHVDLPTVLLSHVPLYRLPGVPCGPLREHWPPTKRTAEERAENPFDDPNSIRVEKGEQYQNVLDPSVTEEITKRIGNVEWAFSGDDHDYCELVHDTYVSAGAGIKEITVKSISFVMSVRRPGFLMASMWNPIDEHGKSLNRSPNSHATIQTNMCLLPDELSIFIWYGICGVISLAAVAVKANSQVRRRTEGGLSGQNGTRRPVLPLAQSQLKHSAEAEKAEDYRVRNSSNLPEPSFQHTNGTAHSQSAVACTDEHSRLASRSLAARARSVSPSVGGYGLPASKSNYEDPLNMHAGYYAPHASYPRVTSQPMSALKREGRQSRASTIRTLYFTKPAEHERRAVLEETCWLTLRILGPVLLWYLWLSRA